MDHRDFVQCVGWSRGGEEEKEKMQKERTDTVEIAKEQIREWERDESRRKR